MPNKRPPFGGGPFGELPQKRTTKALLWTGGLVVVVLQQDDRPNAGADHSRPNQQVMMSVWLRLEATAAGIAL